MSFQDIFRARGALQHYFGFTALRLRPGSQPHKTLLHTQVRSRELLVCQWDPNAWQAQKTLAAQVGWGSDGGGAVTVLLLAKYCNEALG